MKIIIFKKTVARLTRSSTMSLLLSFAMFSSFALAQQTAPTKQPSSPPLNVLGWQNTQWGMSQTDLQNIFASTTENQAVQLVCGDPHFKSNVCGFKNFQLAGETFTVVMSADKKTGELNLIIIALDELESSKARLTLFEQIEALLTQKYGIASDKKDKDVLDVIFRTRHWSFPSTSIELHYSYVGRAKSSFLTIMYKPPSQDAKKL